MSSLLSQTGLFQVYLFFLSFSRDSFPGADCRIHSTQLGPVALTALGTTGVPTTVSNGEGAPLPECMHRGKEQTNKKHPKTTPTHLGFHSSLVYRHRSSAAWVPAGQQGLLWGEAGPGSSQRWGSPTAATAEPVSDTCGTSVKMYLRMGRKQH